MMKCDEDGIPFLIQKYSLVKDYTQVFFNTGTGRYEFFQVLVLGLILFNNCKLELALKNTPLQDVSYRKLEKLISSHYTWHNEIHEQKMLYKYCWNKDFVQFILDKTENDPDRFYFGKLDYT